MKISFKKPILPCCLIVLMTSSGCSCTQIASKPYPIWGESIFLPTEDGKSRRHLQVLEPSQQQFADACLLIVHGMKEHSGRYEDIARHFAERYRVAGIDMTAHGLSNETFSKAHHSIASSATEYDVSSAYLEQSQVRNLDTMRSDIRNALIYLTERCVRPDGGKSPLFILSHSLGSLVSASYLLEAKNDTAARQINGIIFTGPAFSGTQVPGWRGWFQNPPNIAWHHEN